MLENVWFDETLVSVVQVSPEKFRTGDWAPGNIDMAPVLIPNFVETPSLKNMKYELPCGNLRRCCSNAGDMCPGLHASEVTSIYRTKDTKANQKSWKTPPCTHN